MIAKISIGAGFQGVMKYNLQEGKGYLLESNLDNKGNSVKQIVDGLNATRELNNRVQKPVFHMAVSFSKEDQVDDEKMKEIGHEYMKRLGFQTDGERTNPYVMIKHTDTQHQHFHIVASRINYKGEAWNNSKDYERANIISRELEKEYKLHRVPPIKGEYNSIPLPEINKEKRLKKEHKEYQTPRKHLIENINKSLAGIGGGKKLLAHLSMICRRKESKSI